MFRYGRIALAAKKSAKYKAVLFDLDGTLLDTLDDLADSMNASLKRMGYPAHSKARYKIFVGEGGEMLARRALPTESRSTETVATCVKHMRAIYAEKMFTKTKPYAGVPDLLEELQRRGILLAVLSNKPDEPTRQLTCKFFPKCDFACIMGSRPEIPRKPVPVGAATIAGFLGVAPEKFMYLGDTCTDMKTASGAGMYPVGALWGFRGAEELSDNGARTLIETPLDLLNLLK